MQKNKLQFTFINTNTPNDTVKAIKNMVIEHIVQQEETKKLNLSEKTA